MTNWGQTIRDLMKQQRVSQRALEAASGVNRSTLKRCLKGQCQPKADVLERLLSPLGYSIMMSETGEPVKLPERKAKPKLIKAAGCERGY